MILQVNIVFPQAGFIKDASPFILPLSWFALVLWCSSVGGIQNQFCHLDALFCRKLRLGCFSED